MSGDIIGPILGAAIGAAAVLATVLITNRRETSIRKEDRIAAARTELRQAMHRYLAAINGLTAEMPAEPPKSEPSALDGWIMKLAKATSLDFLAFIVGRLLQRAMYGDRPGILLDRLADASAHLGLVAPPAIDALIAEAENLTRSYAPHDERWMTDWKEYRARLRQGFRNELENPTNG